MGAFHPGTPMHWSCSSARLIVEHERAGETRVHRRACYFRQAVRSGVPRRDPFTTFTCTACKFPRLTLHNPNKNSKRHSSRISITVSNENFGHRYLLVRRSKVEVMHTCSSSWTSHAGHSALPSPMTKKRRPGHANIVQIRILALDLDPKSGASTSWEVGSAVAVPT